MEEELCSIRIVKDNNEFVAYIQDYSGTRECCRSEVLEEVVSQLNEEVLDQFDLA